MAARLSIFFQWKFLEEFFIRLKRKIKAKSVYKSLSCSSSGLQTDAPAVWLWLLLRGSHCGRGGEPEASLGVVLPALSLAPGRRSVVTTNAINAVALVPPQAFLVVQLLVPSALLQNLLEGLALEHGAVARLVDLETRRDTYNKMVSSLWC